MLGLTSGLLDLERRPWSLPPSRRLLSYRSSSLLLRFDEEYELPTGDGERVSPCLAIAVAADK